MISLHLIVLLSSLKRYTMPRGCIQLLLTSLQASREKLLGMISLFGKSIWASPLHLTDVVTWEHETPVQEKKKQEHYEITCRRSNNVHLGVANHPQTMTCVMATSERQG